MADTSNNIGNALAERVRNAYTQKKPLRIVGSGSKRFYGEIIQGEILAVNEHQGITEYEPSELYITARAGTPLAEIETTLREHRQMLAFEPPHLSDEATLGGCIACGLSGPARIAHGAVRDALIGVSIINGLGQILRFGGKVMKNVAGYDVTRLICGSFGTLGVILEATLRVMPMPESQKTIRLKLPEQVAASYINQQILNGTPVSASFYADDTLYLRLSGWRQSIEPRFPHEDTIDNQPDFWHSVKEQQHPFFQQTRDSKHALWRISVPANAPAEPLPSGTQTSEWNGALRWLSSDAEPASVRTAAEKLRGQATLFVGNESTGTAPVFHPLKPEVLRLHQRIKKAFDPGRILNSNRLYPGV